MDTNKEQHKFFFISLFSILLIIFVILIAVVIMYKVRGTGKTNSVSTETTKPMPSQPVVGNGVMQLVMKDSSTSATINSTTSIMVNADSAGKSITGYDVLVSYDPAFLTFSSQVNKDTDYTVINTPQTKSGMVVLSGAKNINNESAVLANTNLLELQFKPLKAGQTTVSIEYVPGSKIDSNLVDTDNQDVLGKVENLTLNIQ